MNICVFCGSSFGNSDEYREFADALGQWMAEKGHVLIFGASRSGLMGSVSDSVLAHGGQAVGVTVEIPKIRSLVHPDLTELVVTSTLAERKAEMLRRSDAFLTLPGGPGTLDELFEVLSLIRAGVLKKPAILVNIDGYYEPLLAQLDRITAVGFATGNDLDSVYSVSDLEELDSLFGGFGLLGPDF